MGTKKIIIKESTSLILDYLEEDMYHYLPESGIQSVRFSGDVTGSVPEPNVNYAGGIEVGDIWWEEKQFTPEQNELIRKWISDPRNRGRVADHLESKFNDYGEEQAGQDDYQRELHQQGTRDDAMTGMGLQRENKKDRKYMLSERQIRMLTEAWDSMNMGVSSPNSMDEMASARDLSKIEGAKLTTHKEVVDAIMSHMNSGKFGSVLFVKTDKSLRQTNVRSAPNSVTAGMSGERRYDPADYNLLLLYDNNKAEANGGRRGAFIQARLEGWMIFKSGKLVYDFTRVNASALASMKPQDQQTVHQTLQNLKAAGFQPIVVEPSAQPAQTGQEQP